jgi:hypothetical protein
MPREERHKEQGHSKGGLALTSAGFREAWIDRYEGGSAFHDCLSTATVVCGRGG